MSSTRHEHSFIYEEQWQVDWLIATALLMGAREHINGNFMRTLNLPEGGMSVYLRDPLPNATVDFGLMLHMLPDYDIRRLFYEGKEHEFFG